jgi:tetratricopeptide (TPR) repeat protein
MAETSTGNTTQSWTSMQTYVMTVVCLLVGFAVGYLLRASRSGDSSAPASAASVPQQQQTSPAAAGASMGQSQQPTPEQLKAMADQQAAPILELLKSRQNNPTLLAEVGNLYYDARDYPLAIDYYQKSLAVEPKNAIVRTDMATSMFFMKDVDHAIAEFDHALKDDPKNSNALFNRGIAKWRGKMDVIGAVADWKLLLKENPNYELANKVQMYIAQATKHANMKPGQSSGKPAM